MLSNNILLVDDDPGTVRIVGRILAELGPSRFATSGAEALRLAQAAPPDVILLDAEMPGMSGFAVCQALKADPHLSHVPVIFITSHTDSDYELTGFGLGAADFIAKPVSAPLVLARVKAQLHAKHQADTLRRVSGIDPQTGLANRCRFDETLAREWPRSRRSGEPLALLLVELDQFDRYAGYHGEPAADERLRSVANALAVTTLRPADLVARYDTWAFSFLLPNTQRDGAEHVARRVLAEMQALAIVNDAESTACVTASIGIGVYDEASTCWSEPSSDSRFSSDMIQRCTAVQLVDATVKALRDAQRSGRNHARLLDIADVDANNLACRVSPPSRDPLRPTSA